MNNHKIQRFVDMLNTGLARDVYDLERDVNAVEDWKVIRWLTLELEKQGVCLDRFRDITREAEKEASK